MALKKSVVVLCRGFFCRLRQCMNKLLLRRRNIPITRMDLGSRTRHWSSRWETSSRWCRPLSMPQAARLSASHCAAFKRSGGRLVTSATVSGECLRRCRRRSAICSTQGKSTASAVAARERSTRRSGWPLLNSRRPASVGVVCRGKKIHRQCGNKFFDGGAQGGLVVFDGEEIIGAVFEHQLARGLVLSVQGVEADFASVQVEL